MEFGLGVQARPVDDFWRMTLREYDAAIAGHNRFHGGGETEIHIDQAWIDDMKLQFPDNPA